MDWKIFFATFATIFLAELGDKTQLANLCLAAKSKSWIPVFCASVAAFAVVTLITVFLGGLLSKFIRPDYIRYGAGALFIIVGVLMLIGKV
ncbi:MAG: TMEM165/GDT1 family protein [Candidatus Omnitrophica bacterium]|nr:TMEM165/GDT1 family protein [Candidatus Omnitrophota bacterium]MBU4478488.1 TMEM165/GDT1 family protein [Candidatus Omnitrophota bacterium]MCG2704086.1 TMEM165/GDT1 family protein [Candidatus Omnitrophota bacterium]